MDEDPPRRDPFAQSDFDAWCQFMMANACYCECGHEKWEHLGFYEPGCSHLGTCVCACFRPTARRWQKPSAA
jgi:hypothetical protein